MIRAIINWYKLVKFVKQYRAIGNDQFTIITTDNKITIHSVKSPSLGSIVFKYK